MFFTLKDFTVIADILAQAWLAVQMGAACGASKKATAYDPKPEATPAAAPEPEAAAAAPSTAAEAAAEPPAAAGPVVEAEVTSELKKLSELLPNFARLVLGCIAAEFCM